MPFMTNIFYFQQLEECWSHNWRKLPYSSTSTDIKHTSNQI